MLLINTPRFVQERPVETDNISQALGKCENLLRTSPLFPCERRHIIKQNDNH
jgi:hypothetical protein